MAKKILVNYDFNKNEIQNARTHNLAAAPSTPGLGQRYYDTVTNCEYFWNGAWIPVDAQLRTGIPLANLAVNPLARANHTGTQLASTISDLTAAVRAVTLIPIGNLTTDPLARANHTGTQTASTISDFGTAVKAVTGIPLANLETDPLARANHTGTQTASTISDFATATRAVTAFPIGNLTTDPLARANHTGTQLASTISDLATTVKGYRHDEFAAPTAAVSWNGQKLTNLGAPTAGSSDAARISDVEAAVQSAAAGIDSKASVRVIATGNIALTAPQTIDGVSVIAGDRVLVTGQTTASQNGVYVVAAGAWTRAADADATGEITPGAFWFVEEGTSNGKTQWRCNNSGSITVGTTAITIVQFGAATTFVAGNGLTLTGNTFDVGAGTGITVGADSVGIDTTVVARKYATTIGDGVSTSITVTHNLNTQDVITQVREVATNQVVEVDIQNNGVNTVVIGFALAPAASSYRVVVHG